MSYIEEVMQISDREALKQTLTDLGLTHHTTNIWEIVNAERK